MASSAPTSNENTFDALHAELCAAITDLANSVEVAVTRMALRIECTTTIADAGTTERLAELLRTTATVDSSENEDIEKVLLVPLLQTTSPELGERNADAANCAVVGELNDSCRWFAATQFPRVAPRQEAYRDESKVAMRILELQDRLSRMKKSRSAV